MNSPKRLLAAHSLLAVLVLTVSLSSSAKQVASTCGGCESLLPLLTKFAKVESLHDPAKRFAVVEKMASEIARLPLVDGELTNEQAKLVVTIFRRVTDEGDRLELLERNIALFEASRDRLAKHLAPGQDSSNRQILRDIDSMIASNKYGQNPPRNVFPPAP